MHDLLSVLQAAVEGGLARLDGAQLGADALPLASEHGDVDGGGVVRVEELAAFGVGLGELAGEELALGGVAVLAGGDLGFQLLAQALAPRLWWLSLGCGLKPANSGEPRSRACLEQ